jgi:excisionase family DNA binding protein
MKRMFFIGLQRPNFSKKGERQNMSSSRQWQNLDGIGSGDASESLDGKESISSQRTHPFEPLLDDVQVAALLKVHPKTVQKMARNGELPAIRVGRYWRFLASALSSWIQQSMVKSLSPVAHAKKGIQ